MLTPLEATMAGGRAGIEAGSRQPLPPVVAGLEVHRNEPQPVRDAEAEFHQALPLPGLRTGPVDLEHPHSGSDLRPALGERVQARTEDDVLAHALAGLFHDQVLDEACPGHDGGPERACALGVHVGTVSPALVGRRQPQADLVCEDVRRRIDLDVHGPPQSDAHCRAVCRRGSLVIHLITTNHTHHTNEEGGTISR
jgi:hypothetical protein